MNELVTNLVGKITAQVINNLKDLGVLKVSDLGDKNAQRYPALQTTGFDVPSYSAVAAMDNHASWSIAGKRGRAIKKKAANGAAAENIPRKVPALPRAPLTAAIAIGVPSNRGTEDSIIKRVKKVININELGIGEVKIRTAQSGDLLVVVPKGDGNCEQADLLADKIRGVINDDTITINRLRKMSDIMISGVDPTVEPSKITAALDILCQCSATDFKVSRSVRMRSGESAVWVRCSVEQATKACETGRVVLGWTRARISPARQRPQRCFKCLGYGHVRSSCKSAVDLNDRCFKCTGTGHFASDCTTAVWCVLCNKSHRTRGMDCPFNKVVEDAGNLAVPNMVTTSMATDSGSGGLPEIIMANDGLC